MTAPTAGSVLRGGMLALSRSARGEQLVTSLPVTATVVDRFVAGESLAEAIDVVRTLVAGGLWVSLDRLGEHAGTPEQAAATASAYVDALRELGGRRLAPRAEVSLKLSALGQAMPRDGERVALEHARTVCGAARAVGTTVTLDMEDHTTTDSTLRVLRALRADFPETGAVLQAYLRRTEQDCHDLASAGSRVRLCKGAYSEPVSVSYQRRQDVDRSYVRCLRILMSGDGYPMAATHDPRIISIAEVLAERYGRDPGSFEFQMLYGVRPDEQRRLAGAGARVRVYVPYGREWYPYFMRRLAERPANVRFLLRALGSRG